MTREHPIENLMKSTMENIRDMVDVNTIIGDAVETRDGTYIIPISKVSFGFASGGSEFDSHNKVSSDLQAEYPFGGGSGAGVSVKPVAFLVVRENCVRLLPVEQDNTYDRIVDTVPQVIEMLKDAFNSTIGNKKCGNNSHHSELNSTPSVDDIDFTSNYDGHDVK
ncbi:GerW family sporulation protein [Clostridium sardiniense]|uniref:GerW family sporulation protein n=1 Tax=Clostridium sardiniense TaxID=29369 RepID=A0ABS7L2U9_CLOSR|nr:GerW family sporulation protein [Clostridium sardiniense]MBY0757403.1 GerW family sporulation protein [Clostridium sardiniense]MDQ0461969.1 sporulation protein YtfJ [Clostridium sardiniense]